MVLLGDGGRPHLSDGLVDAGGHVVDVRGSDPAHADPPGPQQVEVLLPVKRKIEIE